MSVVSWGDASDFVGIELRPNGVIRTRFPGQNLTTSTAILCDDATPEDCVYAVRYDDGSSGSELTVCKTDCQGANKETFSVTDIATTDSELNLGIFMNDTQDLNGDLYRVAIASSAITDGNIESCLNVLAAE